jgi:hypothetical protein
MDSIGRPDYGYTTIVSAKREHVAPKNLLGAKIKRAERAGATSLELCRKYLYQGGFMKGEKICLNSFAERK